MDSPMNTDTPSSIPQFDVDQFHQRWIVERLILLSIILERCIGSYEMDESACDGYWIERGELTNPLQMAYGAGSYIDLLSHPAQMPPAVTELVSKHIVASRVSGSEDSLKSAFEKEYIDETHTLLIETMNEERKLRTGAVRAKRPYNWSFLVAQPLGTGQSRMVEEAGSLVFTIPINLREDLSPGTTGIRQYLELCRGRTDKEQRAAYAELLRTPFETAGKLAKKRFPGRTGADLVLAWADYLKEGQFDVAVGMDKQIYLHAVVAEATSNRAGPDKGRTRRELIKSLQDSCRSFISVINPNQPYDVNACFVYFDEAHASTRAEEVNVPAVSHEDQAVIPYSNLCNEARKRTPYDNLGWVLSALVDMPIFFSFSSTNFSFKEFAPPLVNFPSAHRLDGTQLIPPFTELLFDVFENKLTSLTLDTLRTTQAIVRFSRPLWHTQYQILPANSIDFALGKLTALGHRKRRCGSLVAALGVRIGITFDRANPAAQALQSRLVEVYMRVVYSISRHRAYTHTGSPSEPILAEAAARYLNADDATEQIAFLGPKYLAEVCHKGLLERGKQGELYGRLLVTIAHDLALWSYLDRTGIQLSLDRPRYHYPVPLSDFMRALFRSEYHERILKAKPINNSDEADNLEQAFSDSFLFFSHFALAEDSEILSTFGLTTALVRGMAIQAKDNQTSINAVIPIHMGSPTTPIPEKTTSAINLQFKNRKQALDCKVDGSITVPDKATPVISIIFEFGSEDVGVEVKRRSHPVTRQGKTELHQDDRHYEIVVRGRSSEVFGVIEPGTKSDQEVILGAGTIVEDLPRSNELHSLEAL
ncbi:hypothetical protein FRC07_004680 [Ceratobasidium sp. 392]|nr:hypothetical protein FRC07_004680 [Ceratobasidium sp. 392]